MSQLAIHGGAKAVDCSRPHYVWPKITDDLRAAVQAQVGSTLSIAGSDGIFGQFESAFCSYHGRKHGVLFNSGTSALFAAFMSLQLKPGDSVIVPDYTFFATASPLTFFPVDVRFADCDGSGNISAEAIERLIDTSTRAVVITHLWGIPCELDQIASLCRAKGVILIEDCSHAHGAMFGDRLCGSYGDLSIWSLQGQKIVSGGEGGILLTDSDDLFELAVLAGHFGPRTKELIPEHHRLGSLRVTGMGLKLRAHPVAVAIAMQQFSNLDLFLAGKRRNAERFLSVLSQFDFLGLPDTSNRKPSWYSLTFRVLDDGLRVSADALNRALLAEGCTEVDRPSSTRNISTYGIFSGKFRELGLVASSSNINEVRLGARSYFAQAIKLPVWAFGEDDNIVDLYLDALEKVCKHIERGGVI